MTTSTETSRNASSILCLPSPISAKLVPGATVTRPWGRISIDWVTGQYVIQPTRDGYVYDRETYPSRAAALARAEGLEAAHQVAEASKLAERARVERATQAAAAGDVAALLSVEWMRAEIRRLVDGGKASRYGRKITGAAPRATVSAAKKIMQARADRRANRGQVRKATECNYERILRLRDAKRAEAARVAARKAEARLIAGKLGRKPLADLIDQGKHLESVSPQADGLIRSVVAAVGRIGDQTASDLRELETGERFSGKRGRNHRLARTTVCRVERLSDWSAVLLTLRDYSSFGSSSWGSGDSHYGSRGGSAYRCYLIVRDTTTGESHILRVPPKFGNDGTQFFRAFSAPKDRIRAAVAWTFGRESGQYRPDVEA